MKKILLSLVMLIMTAAAAWADVIPATKADVGKVVCSDGSIYVTVSAATAAGKTAQAMIAYVDDEFGTGLGISLEDGPISEADKIDKDLERDMEEVLEIVTLGRSVRALKTLKNRQPLSKMYVIGAPSLNEYYASVIEDELNVKEIEYTSDLDKFVNYSLKLNFRSLGPKVGKNIGLVKNALSEMDQAKAYKEFKTNSKLKVLDYELDENDLIIETHEASDYASISDSKITVVLDTNLTEELIDEGYVREVVSKIQTERKEAGFEVVDHITLSFEGDDKLLDIIRKYESKIASQTLADKVLYNESLGYSKDWEISPYNLKISVKKV